MSTPFDSGSHLHCKGFLSETFQDSSTLNNNRRLLLLLLIFFFVEDGI